MSTTVLSIYAMLALSFAFEYTYLFFSSPFNVTLHVSGGLVMTSAELLFNTSRSNGINPRLPTSSTYPLPNTILGVLPSKTST